MSGAQALCEGVVDTVAIVQSGQACPTLAPTPIPTLVLPDQTPATNAPPVAESDMEMESESESESKESASAGGIVDNGSSPPFAGNNNNNNNGDGGGGGGVVVAIVIAAAVLLLIAAIAFLAWSKRRQRRDRDASNDLPLDALGTVKPSADDPQYHSIPRASHKNMYTAPARQGPAAGAQDHYQNLRSGASSADSFQSMNSDHYSSVSGGGGERYEALRIAPSPRAQEPLDQQYGELVLGGQAAQATVDDGYQRIRM